MKSHFQRWSAAADSRLREMTLAAMTDREIGRKLGRSAGACRARRHMLNLMKRTRHDWSCVDWSKTNREISDATGINMGTLRWMRRTH